MSVNRIETRKLKKISIIYNRNSGKQFFASMMSKINEILKLLKLSHGAKNVELIEFKRFEEFPEITRMLKEKQVEWVIIAGGDGTIRAMIEAMQAEDYHPYISIFPAGTVNLIAKELLLSSEPLKWLKRVKKGIQVPVYLGRCNGHLFLTVAGIGFDSLVVDKVTEFEKKLLSKFAYVVQGTEVMRKEMIFSNWRYHFQVRFDEQGEWYDCSSVIVGKSKYYAGRYNLFREAALKAPVFYTALFKGGNRGDFMRYTTLIGLENIENIEDIMIKSSKIVEVKANVEAFPVELDGDAVTATPLRIEIVETPVCFFA